MPRITIHTCGTDGAQGPYTLSERVIVADLESEHYAGQLIERIAWAVTDAEAIEASAAAAAAHRSPGTHARGNQKRLSVSPPVVARV